MADLTDTLARLLDDPEIQAAAEETDTESEAEPAVASPFGALPPDMMGKLPALMGALSPMLGKANGKIDEKTALLSALKPYMSPGRCDAIDKLITVCRFGEIFKQMR